ncbi:aldo/keto reductase [Euzebyella marina]|uniref:Aldo/keto reductase n=1 Tax=Euzebyella marina TaxID=1761453 RepID=A0A3G2L103_9FLAO|nr:aldo/keto reductase [Euzebyella marina]AYN65901.1 aldo/keto reductase [Euzebyella marina]
MQSNIFLSNIIAGTMTWGSWGKQFSTAQMVEMIHHCLQIGITTFDHADIYGDYGTETQFGEAFKESKVSRSEVQFISKCGIQMPGFRNNRVKHYDYSKDYIISSAEQSLKNLKTEYLDILLLHRPSPLLNIDEVAEAIQYLQDAGKIKEFGVSNFNSSQIAQLEKRIPVRANQVEFSLTQSQVMYDGTLDDCSANDRLAMAWSPLGVYFNDETPMVRRLKEAMTPLIEKYDATEDQILLAWVMKHPSNIRPVVGTTTKSRLSKAIDAVQIDLDLQDWFVLLEAAKGNEVP